MKYFIPHPAFLFVCLLVVIGSLFYYFSDDIREAAREDLERRGYIIEYKGDR